MHRHHRAALWARRLSRFTLVRLFGAVVALATALLAFESAAAARVVPAPSSPAPRHCNAPAADAVDWIDLPEPLPFQAISSADGCWIFVSVATGANCPSEDDTRGGIALLRRENGRIKTVRVVHIRGNPQGMALSGDGRLLVVADTDRMAFIDVRQLTSGGDPIRGYWKEKTDAGGPCVPGYTYASLTSDSRLLFVSDEQLRAVSVLDIARARRTGLFQGLTSKRLPVGMGPVAVTLSHDDRYLYVTSMSMPDESDWPKECAQEWLRSGADRVSQGAIFVIDLRRLTTAPASSIVSIVKAGCTPVRLVLSPDGRTAYVSARGGDTLLAFDTNKLVTAPDQSLIARVPTGEGPIGISALRARQTIVVSDSDRFGPGGTQSLLVVDGRNMRSGKAAILGTIPARRLPREMRTTADGKTLMVVNTLSRQLQVIDVLRLGSVLKPLERNTSR